MAKRVVRLVSWRTCVLYIHIWRQSESTTAWAIPLLVCMGQARPTAIHTIFVLVHMYGTANVSKPLCRIISPVSSIGYNGKYTEILKDSGNKNWSALYYSIDRSSVVDVESLRRFGGW